MKRIFLSLGAAASLMLLPAAVQAQVPVVLVCQDGKTQPGSSQVACGDHGGINWDATRAWTEMRAGNFVRTDTLVCSDGKARAGAPGACKQHGGVDSASTLAWVQRRVKELRHTGGFPREAEQTTRQGGTVGRAGEKDTSRAQSAQTSKDSTKWGYPTSGETEVQNPPGYRGMERAVDAFPPDTTEGDTAPPEDATTRVNQMKRQDSLESNPQQNPPGYRGLERPARVGSDTMSDTTEAWKRTSEDTTSMRQSARPDTSSAAETRSSPDSANMSDPAMKADSVMAADSAESQY